MSASQVQAKMACSYILPAILAVALSLAAVMQAHAQTSVWRLSDGKSTVYLGGTFPLLRVSDYPLPAAFEQAYSDSAEVYFETDIGAAQAMNPAMMELMQRLYYADGRTLKTVLDKTAYAALSAYLHKTGIPMEAVRTARPGMLSTMLQLTELSNLGFTPQGVDTYFDTKSMGDGKPIGKLETLEEQFDMLASVGEGYESKLVMLTLRDIGKIGAEIEIMLAAWRTGDVKGIEESFLEELIAELPQLHDELLLQRNLRWLPQIEALFDDAATEFVLVGVGHIVGEGGLLQLLQDKGYTIEQLGK